MKEIQTRNNINASIRIPGSKSISHRALITAGLAKGESRLEAFLDCEDTFRTINGLRDMGIDISAEGDRVLVSGNGGDFDHFVRTKEIFLGNSGTSYRLLLSVAALGQGEYILHGTPRMQERPIGDLVQALNDLGVNVFYLGKDGYPPVSVRAKGIHGGRVRIPGKISSQYISSLLLTGAYGKKDLEIEVIGDLVSRPYVDITIDVMNRFGVQVERDAYAHFKVQAGSRYHPCSFIVDGDISSASYFWGAAAVTGGTIITENIHPYQTRQGDIGLLGVLEEMGCRIIKDTDRVTVQGGQLRGVDVDMGAMPDMVPTLAAVALFAEGKTVIRNVAHLRYKESDRLRDLAVEWVGMGGVVDVLNDGLVIHGGSRLTGRQVDPHHDHRLAMSAGIIGLRVPGVRVIEENCVEKSFPTFWEWWDGL
ncbi:MAG: 3-phosphoshikimate 1-carboxyvinyltransferase [Deltaproteobacteria bacterium]|nr:3-phosphoshikimate 1-carboxyvinyltransferase [Deltaproteobacteria bacterium]